MSTRTKKAGKRRAPTRQQLVDELEGHRQANRQQAQQAGHLKRPGETWAEAVVRLVAACEQKEQDRCAAARELDSWRERARELDNMRIKVGHQLTDAAKLAEEQSRRRQEAEAKLAAAAPAVQQAEIRATIERMLDTAGYAREVQGLRAALAIVATLEDASGRFNLSDPLAAARKLVAKLRGGEETAQRDLVAAWRRSFHDAAKRELAKAQDPDVRDKEAPNRYLVAADVWEKAAELCAPPPRPRVPGTEAAPVGVCGIRRRADGAWFTNAKSHGTGAPDWHPTAVLFAAPFQFCTEVAASLGDCEVVPLTAAVPVVQP